MIDRDSIMEEAKRVFGEAWNYQNNLNETFGVQDSRRVAGLHEVFDLLEKKYIMVEKSCDDES